MCFVKYYVHFFLKKDISRHKKAPSRPKDEAQFTRNTEYYEIMDAIKAYLCAFVKAKLSQVIKLDMYDCVLMILLSKFKYMIILQLFHFSYKDNKNLNKYH